MNVGFAPSIQLGKRDKKETEQEKEQEQEKECLCVSMPDVLLFTLEQSRALDK